MAFKNQNEKIGVIVAATAFSLVIVVILLVLLGSFGVFSPNTQTLQSSTRTEPKSDRAHVVTSIYPWYYLSTLLLSGTDISVEKVTPNGVEAHDFEPTVQQFQNIYQAKIVVVNGMGNSFEPWLEKVSTELKARGALVIDVGEKVTSADASHFNSASRATDPHIWLNPRLTQTAVMALSEAFQGAFPEQTQTIKQNTTYVQGELKALSASFDQGLHTCKLHTFVSSHDSLRYIASEYQLTGLSIGGLTHDEEPTTKKLQTIVANARAAGVQAVLVDPAEEVVTTHSVAQELGVSEIPYSSIENLSDVQVEKGMNYFSMMRDNLNSLKSALQCT